ncbi:MAG: transposase [Steroidobacteraceae bacterium]
MSDYLRAWIPGGTYFFTVNLAERQNNSLLVDRIALLRRAFREVNASHPFELGAIVVLPEHLHCLWHLPSGDNRFDQRWRLIKTAFSRSLIVDEPIAPNRQRRGERGIWQRRYWEHVIRDEEDWWRHVEYIHYNPVKHGHVRRVCDWPHSSFHRFVRRGLYPADWAAPKFIQELNHE